MVYTDTRWPLNNEAYCIFFSSRVFNIRSILTVETLVLFILRRFGVFNIYNKLLLLALLIMDIILIDTVTRNLKLSQA